MAAVGRWEDIRGGWEEKGARSWEDTLRSRWGGHNEDKEAVRWGRSKDSKVAATAAREAGDLCKKATALRRTLHKMPGLINQRNAFLQIIK